MANIATSGIILATASFLNYTIYFLKSILVAHYFGTGPALDAYFISTIPLFLASGILSISLQISFIPVYVEKVVAAGRSEANNFCRTLSGLAFLVFAILAGSVALFPLPIVSLVAPGFTEENRLIAASLLVEVSPAILLSGLCEAINGIFYGEKKFLEPSAGSLLNVGLTLAYLILFHGKGVHVLAQGTVIGAAAQFLFLIHRSGAAGYKVFPKFRAWDPGVRKVLSLFLPIALAQIFSNVNFSVDQMMASILPAGGISALNYAGNIYMAFSSLFVFSIGTAVLPFFSRQVAEGDFRGLGGSYTNAVRMGLFLCIPTTVVILVCGTPIIRILFERGSFDSGSTLAVSGALKAFSPSLVFLAISIPIVRILTAFQKNKIIAYVGSVSVLTNVVFNFIFMRFMGHVGIALSTSMMYLISLVAFVLIIRKFPLEIDFMYLTICGIKIMSATIFAMIFPVFYLNVTGNVNTMETDIISFIIWCIGFLVLSRYMKIQELDMVIKETRKIFTGEFEYK